jgi:hypothetical protein
MMIVSCATGEIGGRNASGAVLEEQLVIRIVTKNAVKIALFI